MASSPKKIKPNSPLLAQKKQNLKIKKIWSRPSLLKAWRNIMNSLARAVFLGLMYSRFNTKKMHSGKSATKELSVYPQVSQFYFVAFSLNQL